MGEVVALFESYRKKRYQKEVTPEDPKSLIDFAKAGHALRRRQRFDEYSTRMLEMETECARLINQRRCGWPHSEKLARRAVQIFIEETDDLVEFLKDNKDGTTTCLYLGAAGYDAGALWNVVNSFSKLPTSYTEEFGRAIFQIETRLDGIRNSLGHIFEAETTPLPAPAYIL